MEETEKDINFFKHNLEKIERLLLINIKLLIVLA